MEDGGGGAGDVGLGGVLAGMGKDMWILGNRAVMINECRLERDGVHNGKLGG